MGILEKLGIKKKPDQKAKAVTRISEVGQESAVRPVQEKKVPQLKKKSTSRAYEILVRPVLSEKGTKLASLGIYVFAVHPRANKSEIKKSVQDVYDVHVEKISVVKMPSKKRRFGRSQGLTSAWKKAIITLRKGEKIPGIIESVG